MIFFLVQPIEMEDVISEGLVKTEPKIDLTNDTDQERAGLDSHRAKMLKARYGHVAPGSLITSKSQHHLHIRVDERAVNQGLCFFNAEQEVYYMRSRRSCPLNQLPKEIISMDLERPTTPTGHTHVEFCVVGKDLD